MRMRALARFWLRTFPPSRQALKETDRRLAERLEALNERLDSMSAAIDRDRATLIADLDALSARQAEAETAMLVATAPMLKSRDFVPTYLPDSEPYPLFNPSVTKHDGRIVYIARCTNYTAHRDGFWTYKNPPHATYNVMFRQKADDWDRQVVDDTLLRERLAARRFTGMEDMRLFVWKGRLWGACAFVFLAEGADHVDAVSQAIVAFDGAQIADFFVFDSPLGRGWEKNWIPLVRDERLYLVYSFDPVVVFEVVDGRLDLIEGDLEQPLPFLQRGSTQLIPFRGAYLGLVHSKQHYVGPRLHYLHSFVFMTRDFELAQISSRFFIQRRGIEFACGLLDTGEDLILSYGLTERRAAFCRITYQEIDRWMA